MESIYFCTSAKLFCIRNNQQAFFSRNSPDISHSLYLPILISHSLYPLIVMFPTTFIFHSLCLPIPVSQSLFSLPVFFTIYISHFLYLYLPFLCFSLLVSYLLYLLLLVSSISYILYSLYFLFLMSPILCISHFLYLHIPPRLLTGTTCPLPQVLLVPGIR